jgi:hypothetical protein
MPAKTHSTKEVESPLSVLLLHVSVRFARLLAALPMARRKWPLFGGTHLG